VITFIVRRLLLMLPTLVGISFLIFMLIALSPGGIGAGVSAAGAGGATGAAQQQAYAEERYGLDDPVLVQYFRWLHRVSPIKFGARDQLSPGGELIRLPREVRPAALLDWDAGEWRKARDSRSDVELLALARAQAQAATAEPPEAYRRAARAYAEGRVRQIDSGVEFRSALERYVGAVGVRGAFDSRNQPREAIFTALTPERSRPEWTAVEKAGRAMVEAYNGARERRAALVVAIEARPFPQVGVPIVPGVLSVAAPDLGTSFSKNRSVADLILTALPVTMLINLLAFPLIYAVAIPGGMLAASRRGTWIDSLLGALAVGLWSIPTVWAGVLAIGFLARPSGGLGAFPVAGLHDNAAAYFAFLPNVSSSGAFERGWLLDLLWHIALPVACLVYGGFAVLSKQTRAAMLENFSADYVRTAKAKGVPRRDVVLRHVFRNSLLPLITMFVSIFPAMLAGSVIVEQIFSVPGMGSLMIESINVRDREVILANTLMIAIVNLLALLGADLLYALADPRVSYGSER